MASRSASFPEGERKILPRAGECVEEGEDAEDRGGVE